jgi:hypothetical protein
MTRAILALVVLFSLATIAVAVQVLIRLADMRAGRHRKGGERRVT